MKSLVYDPAASGERMTVACFVSGSGTNYARIAEKNRQHRYIVFTNRPGCGGEQIARQNRHEVVALSHLPYLAEARQKYGTGNVPRNCPEREAFEREAVRLIEQVAGGTPDLVCLAGYDQWVSDWMVDNFYPRMLNVHPGDTTRGYDGLHWVPTARAILAGEGSLRSTLFVVDKGEDTGPVLVQSRPLDILKTLREREYMDARDWPVILANIRKFASEQGITGYEKFQSAAGRQQLEDLKQICRVLQEQLKIRGDWEIYPLAVGMIAAGCVAVDDRKVYVDGKPMPAHGYRPD